MHVMTEPSPLAKGYGPSPLLSTLVSVKQSFCGHTCMTSKNPGLADVYGDRFNWMQKTIAATNSECIRGNRGSLHLVKTGRHDFSFNYPNKEVWENLGDFHGAFRYFNASLITITCLLHFCISQYKYVAQQCLKSCNQQVWNKILNIKPCIGQISGIWDLLIHKYGRKTMVIDEKILISKHYIL